MHINYSIKTGKNKAPKGFFFVKTGGCFADEGLFFIDCIFLQSSILNDDETAFKIGK